MRKLLILLSLALGTLQAQAFSLRVLRVDDRLPAGNIVVDKIVGDTVFVQPDMTGHKDEWFYWAMRVRGAQGKTVVFQFPRTCVGARGPVVSLDKGKTFFFAGGDSRTVTFFSDRRSVTLYHNDIAYIESNDTDVRVVTRSGEVYRNKTGISQWENLLGDGFLRIHRSYLVNIEMAVLVSPDTVAVGTSHLPVSRKYKEFVNGVLPAAPVPPPGL